MTKLDFISGMKRLSSYYLKELTNDQLEAWYEMFKNVRVEDFNIAIKLISKENEYMPTAQMLYKKCSQAYKEWKDSEMEKFLRPETLFSNKFESYYNQPEIMKQRTLKDISMAEIDEALKREKELMGDKTNNDKVGFY